MIYYVILQEQILCFCILLSALYAVYIIRYQCEIKHDDSSRLGLFIRQLWKSDLEVYSMCHFGVLMYIKGLNRFRYRIQRTLLCHQPLCHTVRSYLRRIYYAYWRTFLMPESLFSGPGVFRISVSSKYFNPKHLSKIIMIDLCLILSESLFPGPDMTILIHNSLLHISSWI